MQNQTGLGPFTIYSWGALKCGKPITKRKLSCFQNAIPSVFFFPKLIELPFILSSKPKAGVILISSLPHPM